MDKKITELDSIEKLDGHEYFVVASDKYDENYKLNVSDFIEQLDSVEVDKELSLLSNNPVQNKVITQKINEINDVLEDLDNRVSNWEDDGEPVDFDISIKNVQTITADPGQQARVEVIDLGTQDSVKSLQFKFQIPKGIDGINGRDGKDGVDGDTPVAHKSVMAFKSSNTAPNTPIGGRWDVTSDIIFYPTGWSSTDDLEKPIWMSVGEFSSAAPNNPTWSKPIMITGEDGTNGSDGVSTEFIYKATKTSLDVPEKPESVNETDYIPDGWTDRPTGISETYQVEWVCSRKKNVEGNWQDWDGPVIWAKWGTNGIDGDGVEYIYKRNNGGILENPTPEDTTTDEYQGKGDYENKEYVPEGWEDNPLGVNSTLTHEWVCVRKQKDGVWQAFSDPALWAKYGEDGFNGVSVMTMYAKTDSSADKPIFIQDNINPGSIWGLVIPTYDSPEAIWSISAYVTYDNKLATIIDDQGNEVYGWHGPILVSGVAGIDGVPVNYKTYVYKLSDTKPNKPTSDDPKNPGNGWIDYPNTTGQWWQCVGTVNGVTEMIATDKDGNLLWSEVLPVNGRDGVAQDGKRVEFRFTVHTSRTISPSIDKTVRQPSGWAMQPPAVESGQYLWMTTATINSDDTLVDNWSDPVCISGEQGPIGKTGPTGLTGPMGPSGVSGIPGVSVKTKYCLGKEDSYIATYNNTVANDLDPVEYGWANIIPSVTQDNPYIWCIQTRIIYNRDLNDPNLFVESLEEPWCTPFRLTGVNGIGQKGVGISSVDEYYLVSNKNSGITIAGNTWTKNAIPAFTSTKVYLWNYEVINYEDGTSANPTTPAVIGVQGKDGRGIVSIVEKYAASSDPVNHPATTSNSWKTNAGDAITSANNPYLWNWEHILYNDSTTDDFFIVIGSRGSDGESAKGQMIYPAGVYSSNTTYTTTSIKAPYVFDPSDGNYYVMNYIGTWLGTTQGNLTPSQSYVQNGSKYWTLLEAFDAIYANVGIIENGLIGSAVFNNEFMFSQQGIDANGKKSTSYENFYHDDPYNPLNKFRPNWCVNLATGEQWLGAGKIYFAADGSGRLANGNVTFDKDGNLTINSATIGKNRFNANGSGYLANGNIEWDANGLIYRKTIDIIRWVKALNYAGSTLDLNAGNYFDLGGNGLNDESNSPVVQMPTIINGDYETLSSIPDGYRICIAIKSNVGALHRVHLKGNFYITAADGKTTQINSYLNDATVTLYNFSGTEVWLTYVKNSDYWHIKINNFSIDSGKNRYILDTPLEFDANVEFVSSLPSNPVSGKLYVVG